MYLFIYLTLHEKSPMIHRYPTGSTVSTSPVRGVLIGALQIGASGWAEKVAHPLIHLAVPKKEGMVTEASSKIL